VYHRRVAEETGTTPGCSVEETASRLSIPVEQVRDLIAADVLKTIGGDDDLRVTSESLFMYMVSRLTMDLKKVTAPRRTLASVSDLVLPVLMGLWFMAACFVVFSVRGGHKPVLEPPGAAFVLAALLALAWWLARQADDFSSVQGMGTALYDWRRRMTPEGKVGTQWLVLVSIPLLPIRSYVILETGEAKSNWSGAIQTAKFRVRSMDRIYWPQALPILAGVWAGVAALIALALLA
jgi:hypothetical protein